MTNSHRPPLPMADYDFDLPAELIAQLPIEPRDASRLLVLDRRTGAIEHRTFRDIGDYLRPGDLLVLNDTRVLPGRLSVRRPTGGVGELLLLRRLEAGVWQAIGRPQRRLRPGVELEIMRSDGAGSGLATTVRRRLPDGLLEVEVPDQVEARLADFGAMPLPPYIRQHLEDAERYQTVYADVAGSAAAPTAGLHFTQPLLDQLQRSGVVVKRLTLHVGLGTFLPVKVDDAREHRMHAEWYTVPEATVAALREARERQARIVAVGTTSCRTLESIGSLADAGADISGWTDIFITPGYRFKLVDSLVTNFHLPRSTLLLLVSAFAGRERILAAYREAIQHRYRFFSFGDSMLIL